MKDYTKRNEFLTELIGVKVHRDDEDYPSNEPRRITSIDFSAWEGMGLLLEFSKKQCWWEDFISQLPILTIDSVNNVPAALKSCFGFVEPDNLANAIDNFLNPEKVIL